MMVERTYGSSFNTIKWIYIVLSALFCVVDAQADVWPMRKGPYLIYPGNPTDMMVLWQMDDPSTCVLEWRRAGTEALAGYAVTEPRDLTYAHRYVMTDLEPGAAYTYAVHENNRTHTGQFRAAPTSETQSVEFIALGDSRTYTDEFNRLADQICSPSAGAMPPDLIIHTGDFTTYGAYHSYWDREYFSRYHPALRRLQASTPIQPVAGNHETTAPLFNQFFPLPYIDEGLGRYYAFDYGPIHFTVLDQYNAFTTDSAQLEWLEQDLAQTDRPWKILVLHHPGWGAGTHPNHPVVQSHVQPLCERFGVQLVLGGHNHNYSRAMVRGVTHVVTGGAGAPKYIPDQSYPFIIRALAVTHFCRVRVSGQQMSVQAIDLSGHVIESVRVPFEVRPGTAPVWQLF